MVNVKGKKLPRMFLGPRTRYLHIIVSDILSFFLQDRDHIGRRATRYRHEQHLDRVRCGTPIAFHINYLCVAAGWRAYEKIVTGVSNSCFVTIACHNFSKIIRDCTAILAYFFEYARVRRTTIGTRNASKKRKAQRARSSALLW